MTTTTTTATGLPASMTPEFLDRLVRLATRKRSHSAGSRLPATTHGGDRRKFALDKVSLVKQL